MRALILAICLAALAASATASPAASSGVVSHDSATPLAGRRLISLKKLKDKGKKAAKKAKELAEKKAKEAKAAAAKVAAAAKKTKDLAEKKAKEAKELVKAAKEAIIAKATLCDKGQGKDASGTHCVDCVLGSSFSSKKGLGKCSPVTVTTCPAGHGLLAATKKSDGRCIKCLKGTERPEGAQTQACTKCAKGKYSDVNGMDCIACDAGEVALDTGLTSCTPCPKGEVEANTRKACNACAAGTYADATGSTSCKECPKGTWGDKSVHNGAALPRFTDGAHCKDCPAGKFQKADGIDKCEQCQAGTFIATDGHGRNGETSCEPCPVIDELHKEWTQNKAGEKRCTPKPLDCEAEPTWGAWGSCMRDSTAVTCGAGARRTRTRGFLKRSPCALEVSELPTNLQSLFTKDELCRREWPLKEVDPWSGATPCEDVVTEQEEPCTASTVGFKEFCPIDCSIEPWGAWSTCKNPSTGAEITCHSNGDVVGQHYRERTVVGPQHDGAACPHTREVAPCGSSCCKGYEHGDDQSPAADNVVTQASVRISKQVRIESVRSVKGHYQIPFADASSVCAARGQGWGVCTHEQVKEAYGAGMNICACAWASNGQMYYPMQTKTEFCGAEPGLHGCGEATFLGATGDVFCCGEGRNEPKCTQCQEGTFSNWLGIGKCQSCPAGQYQDDKAATGCKQCPKGRAGNVPGAQSLAAGCPVCQEGEFAASKGLTQCESCPPGTQQPAKRAQSAQACATCTRGRHATSAGTKRCAACAKGRFLAASQDAAAMKDCAACGAGKAQNAEGSFSSDDCTACGQGHWSAAGAATCTACAAGKASAVAQAKNVATCGKCLAGQFAAKGSARCQECAYGKISTANKAAQCKPCAAGKYNNLRGGDSNSHCKPCPAGNYCPQSSRNPKKCPGGTSRAGKNGKTAAGCGSCKAGTYSPAAGGATACKPCLGGHYQPKPKRTRCAECPKGTAHNRPKRTKKAACLDCQAGRYQPDGGQKMCKKCQKGFFRVGQGKWIKCQKCHKGRYGFAIMAKNLAEGCKRCQRGRYNNEQAQTQCKGCAITQYSKTQGATSVNTCQTCGFGKYTTAPGQETCQKCSKGHYGERQNTVKGSIDHCLPCPQGTHQEADGKDTCKPCTPGQYMEAHGHADRTKAATQCKSCSDLNVDENRVYWTDGFSGASQCVQKKLDCEMGQWSKWTASPGGGSFPSKVATYDQDGSLVSVADSATGETCSKACKAGDSPAGLQTHTRSPVNHGEPGTPQCKVADCAEGWGVGALKCAELAAEDEQECNTHQCPVNCVVSQWGDWTQCTASCGKSGRATRTRRVTEEPKFLGTCPERDNNELQEVRECNTAQSCDFRDMPMCHGEHIHCKVVQKHLNYAAGPFAALNRQANECYKWWVHWQTNPEDPHNPNPGSKKSHGDCHHCDTEAECAVKGIHKTIVVTHDRKYSDLEGQKNMFHCFYAHASHPNKVHHVTPGWATKYAKIQNQCYCACKMHPPCTGKAGRALRNTALFGNHWQNIVTRQDCCNLCTNLDACGSFTYKEATQECTLYAGEPLYAAADDGTWSGAQFSAQAHIAAAAAAN